MYFSVETLRMQDPRVYQALHGPQLSQEAREDGPRPGGPRHQEAACRPAAEAAERERRERDGEQRENPEGGQDVGQQQLPQRRGGLPARQIHQDGKLCGENAQKADYTLLTPFARPKVNSKMNSRGFGLVKHYGLNFHHTVRITISASDIQLKTFEHIEIFIIYSSWFI